MFSCEISKNSRNTFFTEQLHWLRLTFNSYFQRSQEQKPVQLSARNTRFSCEKVFTAAKVSISVREIILGFLSFGFRILFYLSLLWRNGFAVFWFWDIFIIKKLVYNAVQTSSEISPSLRLLLEVCVWKKNKIVYHHDGEQLTF